MKLKDFAVAAALAIAASGAIAGDQSILLAQTGTGMFSAAFSATHLESGSFVDSFVFSLPAAFGSPLGSGAVTFASLSGPISLVVATVDTANGVSVASPPDPASIAVPSTLSFSNGTPPFTLTVLGFSGDPFSDPVQLTASYNGTITFDTTAAAVPEPETYGLMMAGLFVLGVATRKRRARE